MAHPLLATACWFSTTNYRPSEVSNPKSEIGHWLLAIGYRFSTANHPPFEISNPKSEIGHRLSSIGYRGPWSPTPTGAEATRLRQLFPAPLGEIPRSPQSQARPIIPIVPILPILTPPIRTH